MSCFCCQLEKYCLEKKEEKTFFFYYCGQCVCVCVQQETKSWTKIDHKRVVCVFVCYSSQLELLIKCCEENTFLNDSVFSSLLPFCVHRHFENNNCSSVKQTQKTKEEEEEQKSKQ